VKVDDDGQLLPPIARPLLQQSANVNSARGPAEEAEHSSITGTRRVEELFARLEDLHAANHAPATRAANYQYFAGMNSSLGTGLRKYSLCRTRSGSFTLGCSMPL
jgi:hypothetical protein